jgi:hypothetical protein
VESYDYGFIKRVTRPQPEGGEGEGGREGGGGRGRAEERRKEGRAGRERGVHEKEPLTSQASFGRIFKKKTLATKWLSGNPEANN